MGGTTDRLKLRELSRDDWLEGAASRFESDPNIAAAWLFGSLGRGDADELSDIDLFVAIVDAVADDVLPSVETTFADYGRVLSVMEVPDAAAPPTRSFVVTLPAPVERLSVDWFWQRAGDALLGSDARILVDKVGLPVADPPADTGTLLRGRPDSGSAAGGPRRAARRVDRLQQRLSWFWGAVPGVARSLARGAPERTEADLDAMARLVDEASSFLNLPPPDRSGDNGPVRPLARLRGAVVDLAALSKSLREVGLTVPSTEHAYGWLELAEDLDAEGWKR